MHTVTLQPTDLISGATLSPDSGQLLLGSTTGVATLWDLHGGQLVRTLPVNGQVIDEVGFSPCGTAVCLGHASAPYDDQRTTTYWDLEEAKPKWTFPGQHASFHPNDGRLLTISRHIVHVWQVGTGLELQRFTVGHPIEVASWARFRPGKDEVIVQSTEALLQVWDARKGVRRRRLHSTTMMNTILSVNVSASGRYVAVFADDGSGGGWVVAQIFDLEARWWKMRAHRSCVWIGGFGRGSFQDSHSLEAVLHPAHPQLLVPSATQPAQAEIHDFIENRLCQTLSGHEGPIEALAFSHSGQQVLTGASDGTARWWDVASGHCLRTFAVSGKCVRRVAFSPDDRRALAWTTVSEQPWDHTGQFIDAEHTIHIWNLDSGEEMIRITKYPPETVPPAPSR